jgi:hypothetical protein
MSSSEEHMSDEDAGAIIFLLGQIGVKYGFDVARRLIRRWIERLAEKTGYVDFELERGAYDYIREVEAEVEEEKRREQ